MHSPLEEYLKEVSAHLGSLPVARRKEELREMRQHLQNAIAVHQERGQPESEAVQSALAQFGAPQEVGDNLIRAWQRDLKIGRWSLWGSAFCAFVLCFLLPRLEGGLSHLSIFGFFGPYVQAWVILTLGLAPTVLAGVVIGLVFPRHTVAGTAIGLGLWIGIDAFLLFVIMRNVLNADPNRHAILMSLYLWWTMRPILTILGVWIGSRLRAHRRRLVHNL